MSYRRNRSKIKRLQINKTSVNHAMRAVYEQREREKYALMKEADRKKKAKREQIAEAVPWIGELVQNMVEEKEL